jgi:hypothetical protein
MNDRPRSTILLALAALLIACGGETDRRAVPERLTFIRSEQAKAHAGYALELELGRAHGDTTALGAPVTFSDGGMSLAWGRGGDLTMRLGAIGRDGAMHPAAPVDHLAVADNRVTMRHGDGLETWWLNGPLGLEQGFVVTTPPSEGDGPLVLQIDRGGATAMTDGDGGALLVSRPAARRVRYTDLFAFDARGARLPAEMIAIGAHVALRIDDHTAHYPLQIDPLLWTETSKLVASVGASEDLFGQSVAISGDHLIVGAPQLKFGPVLGAAYVYERTGGQWIEQPKVQASDGNPVPLGNSNFGYAVSISGDYAIVGASDDSNPGAPGSAYIYERTGGQWLEQPKLIGDAGGNNAVFGLSVAVDGTYAIVGAPLEDTFSVNNCGAAYIYERSGVGTWVEVIKFFASDLDDDDQFGTSVAISGDTALVGAWLDDGPIVNQGSVYVLERDALGMWSEVQKLVASDASTDNFGYSVAISADRAVIGAWHDDDQGTDSGAAYVFERNAAGTWIEQAKLTASDGESGDNFGLSVAIDGNIAVVGSPFTGFNRGSAYIYERDPSGMWLEQPKVQASDMDNGDQFGSAVAVDGTDILIGARTDEDMIGFNAGSAYLLQGAVEPGSPGSSCGVGPDCNSGFCIDDVCCASLCGDGDPDDCQACSIAAGSTADGVCAPIAQGTVCRAAAGDCDAEEQCDGIDLLCPDDAFLDPATVCRAAASACDVDELCSDGGPACPADDDAPDGTPCDGGVCGDGMCNPDGAGGGAGSGGAGGAGEAPGDNGATSGCGCRSAGRNAPRAPALWWLVAFGVALGLRRTRRSMR